VGVTARRWAFWIAVALLFQGSALPAVAREKELPELLYYEVTEHAPIIKGRHDKAFNRALEAAFRKTVLIALKEIERPDPVPQGFDHWQSAIFSRAADFIATYSIISQEEKEGYLTLTVGAGVSAGKLRRAREDSAAVSAARSVRLLVLVDTFPLSGTAGFEDIDAGHLASRALEAEFLHRGFIILPSPEHLPWNHLEGRATEENKRSLAAAEGGRTGSDYVVLGRLRTRADRLLQLTVELLSPSLKTAGTAKAPVELQTGTNPGESFTDPAGEVARILLPKIGSR